ncbi:hypothetical protein A2U01_0025313, partial [Trifolium medium]|nr:hypothetical protein [Trifolium medium]
SKAAQKNLLSGNTSETIVDESSETQTQPIPGHDIPLNMIRPDQGPFDVSSTSSTPSPDTAELDREADTLVQGVKHIFEDQQPPNLNFLTSHLSPNTLNDYPLTHVQPSQPKRKRIKTLAQKQKSQKPVQQATPLVATNPQQPSPEIQPQPSPENPQQPPQETQPHEPVQDPIIEQVQEPILEPIIEPENNPIIPSNNEPESETNSIPSLTLDELVMKTQIYEEVIALPFKESIDEIHRSH